MILGPQLVYHTSHRLIMSAVATNVVAHVNVEQGKRTVRMGMDREANLVGIHRHGLGNGFGLGRLSHLSLSFFLVAVLYRRRCPVSTPLGGDHTDAHDIARVETLGPHVFMHTVVGTLTVHTVHLSIPHADQMVMAVDWRKGTNHVVD